MDDFPPDMPIGRSAAFPSRVTLQLPSYDCSQPAGGCLNPWTRSVTATCGDSGDGYPNYTLSDAECVGYGDYGFVGEARIFDTAKAYWLSIGDDGEEVDPVPTEPDNQMAVNYLAYAVARDYYGWRRFAFDLKCAGLVPVIPNGYTDEIVWTADDEEWSTRLLSAPPDDRTEQMNHAFNAPGNCTCCEPGHCGFGGCPQCGASTVYIAKSGSSIDAREDNEYSSPRATSGIVRIYRMGQNGDMIPCGYAFAHNPFSQAISANSWLELGVLCGRYIIVSEDCGTNDA